jgi:hypothetical protein
MLKSYIRNGRALSKSQSKKELRARQEPEFGVPARKAERTTAEIKSQARVTAARKQRQKSEAVSSNIASKDEVCRKCGVVEAESVVKR